MQSEKRIYKIKRSDQEKFDDLMEIIVEYISCQDGIISAKYINKTSLFEEYLLFIEDAELTAAYTPPEILTYELSWNSIDMYIGLEIETIMSKVFWNDLKKIIINKDDDIMVGSNYI